MSLRIIYYFLILPLTGSSAGILYPRASESRQLISLDGLWNFAVGNMTIEQNQWQTDAELQLMAVPSSYNDISAFADLRDLVGSVTYQRTFFPPLFWSEKQRVWIRFGSVCRSADVFINEQWFLSHKIGHLPFQAEITSLLKFGEENVVTVVVDNILLNTTVPQGEIQEIASGRKKQTYSFDFFNYAGIDRPVVLYTTPTTYIEDITVNTNIDGGNGLVTYNVKVEGTDSVTSKVTLLDKSDKEVVSDTSLTATLYVKNACFWWPYLMDPNPGYLYSLKVQLFDNSNNLVDQYVQPVGIRSLSWDNKSVYINNKPLYLRGFGRHEDSDFRGKGLDLPVVLRDYTLMKWIGANAYRTSHYPYAEEIMDLADQYGLMIIDESPAATITSFNDELLENHKRSLTELIQRDKNRPSVIMWSAANEPSSQKEAAEGYFKEVVDRIRSLDASRPVTIVIAQLPDDDYVGQFVDVVSTNLYYGWYDNVGDLDLVIPQVTQVVKRWNELHDIPVIVTEYGADTQEGLHLLPSYVWSEEYQNSIMSKYFEAFDQLRKEGFFMGEMIWNFADFKTAQTFTRVGLNKKGIFTRQRQPKASAHFLRKRYWSLAQKLDNVTLPDDLDGYIVENDRY